MGSHRERLYMGNDRMGLHMGNDECGMGLIQLAGSTPTIKNDHIILHIYPYASNKNVTVSNIVEHKQFITFKKHLFV